jgi:hypothetical protein
MLNGIFNANSSPKRDQIENQQLRGVKRVLAIMSPPLSDYDSELDSQFNSHTPDIVNKSPLKITMPQTLAQHQNPGIQGKLKLSLNLLGKNQLKD